MNDTTIFLIRHAKKNSNITYLIDKEETEKDLLGPLSAIGIQQAQKIELSAPQTEDLPLHALIMTRFRQIWNPGCYSSLTF